MHSLVVWRDGVAASRLNLADISFKSEFLPGEKVWELNDIYTTKQNHVPVDQVEKVNLKMGHSMQPTRNYRSRKNQRGT
ncbi:hypothetical protein LZD49_10655 [Dyadobacter sp. CY261]|uniref:hypothetical protein n=1 Tax=Dyadobacter sp. CY261 TaxID=2907203 RepID=UPI001F1A6829|nr:hypothetical protein [Dyadobacter sp. CY261]MCF0070933.1 hypothetical protein [Dyadobacter sp. CY261]